MQACVHILQRCPAQPAQLRNVAAAAYAPNVAQAYDNATAPRQPQTHGQEPPALGVETWLGTGYEIYKRGGALQLKPIVPKFQQSASGTHVLQRKGVLLLEMAAATGTRQYDWANKVAFALSVTEMADLFLVPGSLQGKGVNMLHDPGMQKGNQGEVRRPFLVWLMSCVYSRVHLLTPCATLRRTTCSKTLLRCARCAAVQRTGRVQPEWPAPDKAGLCSTVHCLALACR